MSKAQIREEVRTLRSYLGRFEDAVEAEDEKRIGRWAEQVQYSADRIAALIEQWGRERSATR